MLKNKLGLHVALFRTRDITFNTSYGELNSFGCRKNTILGKVDHLGGCLSKEANDERRT